MNHIDLVGLILLSLAGIGNPRLAFFILLISSIILSVLLW